MTDPWSPVDPLGEGLHLLRMNGVFYCRSEFTAPWALALPPFEACMMFHVVTAGQCWLEVEGANSCHLRPGDLALVPHGEGHRLVGAAGVTAVNLFDAPRELVSDRTRFSAMAEAASRRRSSAASFASITRRRII